MGRLILSLLVVPALLVGQETKGTIRREAVEWTDVWLPHTNESKLPRVLLIGDSITRAYFPSVEEHLKEKAYVARIATSKAIGDPALIIEISVLLQETHFDAVQFNIGMHGWAYSEEEYEQQFPVLVVAIRKYAPQAKLLWANTTPVRKDREGGATNARIDERNAIVKKLAGKEGISVNDLHGLMSTHDDLHSDDVHYSKEGNELMGAQVAGEIGKLLPR